MTDQLVVPVALQGEPRPGPFAELRQWAEALKRVTEDPVGIAPRVFLPRQFLATTEVEGMKVTIHVETNVLGPFAKSVVVDAGADPGGVTSEIIRRVPVAKIVREAAKKVVFFHDPSGGLVIGEWFETLSPEVMAEWPSGDIDRFTQHIAAIYRIADALGEGPTATVAKAAGVSRATAGRFVDATRKQGHLPPTLGPGTSTWVEDERGGRWVVGLPDNYKEEVDWHFRDRGEPSPFSASEAEGDSDG